MKRKLGWLCMLLLLALLFCVSAQAEGKVLSLGTNILGEDEFDELTFVASEEGYYRFTSVVDGDVFCAAYFEDGSSLYDDDDGEGMNFCLAFPLLRGERVDFEIGCYNPPTDGVVTCLLEKIEEYELPLGSSVMDRSCLYRFTVPESGYYMFTADCDIYGTAAFDRLYDPETGLEFLYAELEEGERIPIGSNGTGEGHITVKKLNRATVEVTEEGSYSLPFDRAEVIEIVFRNRREETAFFMYHGDSPDYLMNYCVSDTVQYTDIDEEAYVIALLLPERENTVHTLTVARKRGALAEPWFTIDGVPFDEVTELDPLTQHTVNVTVSDPNAQTIEFRLDESLPAQVTPGQPFTFGPFLGGWHELIVTAQADDWIPAMCYAHFGIAPIPETLPQDFSLHADKTELCQYDMLCFTCDSTRPAELYVLDPDGDVAVSGLSMQGTAGTYSVQGIASMFNIHMDGQYRVFAMNDLGEFSAMVTITISEDADIHADGYTVNGQPVGEEGITVPAFTPLYVEGEPESEFVIVEAALLKDGEVVCNHLNVAEGRAFAFDFALAETGSYMLCVWQRDGCDNLLSLWEVPVTVTEAAAAELAISVDRTQAYAGINDPVAFHNDNDCTVQLFEDGMWFANIAPGDTCSLNNYSDEDEAVPYFFRTPDGRHSDTVTVNWIALPGITDVELHVNGRPFSDGMYVPGDPFTLEVISDVPDMQADICYVQFYDRDGDYISDTGVALNGYSCTIEPPTGAYRLYIDIWMTADGYRDTCYSISGRIAGGAQQDLLLYVNGSEPDPDVLLSHVGLLRFTWEPVEGAVSYDLHYTIDGSPDTVMITETQYDLLVFADSMTVQLTASNADYEVISVSPLYQICFDDYEPAFSLTVSDTVIEYGGYAEITSPKSGWLYTLDGTRLVKYTYCDGGDPLTVMPSRDTSYILLAEDGTYSDIADITISGGVFSEPLIYINGEIDANYVLGYLGLKDGDAEIEFVTPDPWDDCEITIYADDVCLYTYSNDWEESQNFLYCNVTIPEGTQELRIETMFSMRNVDPSHTTVHIPVYSSSLALPEAILFDAEEISGGYQFALRFDREYEVGLCYLDIIYVLPGEKQIHVTDSGDLFSCKNLNDFVWRIPTCATRVIVYCSFPEYPEFSLEVASDTKYSDPITCILPSSLALLEESAFTGTDVNSLLVTSTQTEFAENALRGCGMYEIYLPSGYSLPTGETAWKEYIGAPFANVYYYD